MIKNQTVIVANGTFPVHKIPMGILQHAKEIIGCDGAVNTLIKEGFHPDMIIGDMDSIDKALQKKFKDKITADNSQITNDLTKAANWCAENGRHEIIILGATGKREDHTLANISLLTDYVEWFDSIKMYTDHGCFIPITSTTNFVCRKGQQVSIFSMNNKTKITSRNLKFPLQNQPLQKFWQGTLNEATENNFSLEFEQGHVVVFLGYV